MKTATVLYLVSIFILGILTAVLSAELPTDDLSRLGILDVTRSPYLADSDPTEIVVVVSGCSEEKGSL